MPQSFGMAMGFSLSETMPVADLPSLSGGGGNASRLRVEAAEAEAAAAEEARVVYLAPNADPDKCWPIRPTLRNELDTFSVHFYSTVKGANVTVFGCLNHGMPLFLRENSSMKCESESEAGFLLAVNASSNITKLRIPYPQTGTWYLSLRSLCATEHGRAVDGEPGCPGHRRR
ncbi:hypothetical protein CRUP_009128 [Coryphaenoides rupestris]|nr:hypothetical protein CRUP_009128 [Coryphaenoides rupestris]